MVCLTMKGNIHISKSVAIYKIVQKKCFQNGKYHLILLVSI